MTPCASLSQACAGDVDCQYGSFSSWSACSSAECSGVSCQPAQQYRTAEVIRQSQGKGKPCTLGGMVQTRPCEAQTCTTNSANCEWEPWSTQPWTACSQPCSSNGSVGLQYRFRTVSAPAQGMGDCDCTQQVVSQTCNMRECQPCQAGSWSAWSQCSVPCGGGVQFRTRALLSQGDEDNCPLYETQPCNTQTCLPPGGSQTTTQTLVIEQPVQTFSTGSVVLGAGPTTFLATTTRLVAQKQLSFMLTSTPLTTFSILGFTLTNEVPGFGQSLPQLFVLTQQGGGTLLTVEAIPSGSQTTAGAPLYTATIPVPLFTGQLTLSGQGSIHKILVDGSPQPDIVPLPSQAIAVQNVPLATFSAPAVMGLSYSLQGAAALRLSNLVISNAGIVLNTTTLTSQSFNTVTIDYYKGTISSGTWSASISGATPTQLIGWNQGLPGTVVSVSGVLAFNEAVPSLFGPPGKAGVQTRTVFTGLSSHLGVVGTFTGYGKLGVVLSDGTTTETVSVPSLSSLAPSQFGVVWSLGTISVYNSVLTTSPVLTQPSKLEHVSVAALTNPDGSGMVVESLVVENGVMVSNCVQPTWDTVAALCAYRCQTKGSLTSIPLGGHSWTCAIPTLSCSCQPAVDCAYGSWSSFSTCSVPCGHGGGQRCRTRGFTPPQNGGAECIFEETVDCAACNTPAQCSPVDCKITSFTLRKACPSCCPVGQTCHSFYQAGIVAEATGGGKPCTDMQLVQSYSCNVPSCDPTVDCQYGSWSAWSACDVTCGVGKQTSFRTITTASSGLGAPCSLAAQLREQPCTASAPCPKPCPTAADGSQCGALSGWGTCNTLTGSCSCLGGRTGTGCNFICPSGTGGVCNGRGTCGASTNYTCSCATGWQGPACEQAYGCFVGNSHYLETLGAASLNFGVDKVGNPAPRGFRYVDELAGGELINTMMGLALAGSDMCVDAPLVPGYVDPSLIGATFTPGVTCAQLGYTNVITSYLGPSNQTQSSVMGGADALAPSSMWMLQEFYGGQASVKIKPGTTMKPSTYVGVYGMPSLGVGYYGNNLCGKGQFTLGWYDFIMYSNSMYYSEGNYGQGGTPFSGSINTTNQSDATQFYWNHWVNVTSLSFTGALPQVLFYIKDSPADPRTEPYCNYLGVRVDTNGTRIIWNGQPLLQAIAWQTGQFVSQGQQTNTCLQGANGYLPFPTQAAANYMVNTVKRSCFQMGAGGINPASNCLAKYRADPDFTQSKQFFTTDSEYNSTFSDVSGLCLAPMWMSGVQGDTQAALWSTLSQEGPGGFTFFQIEPGPDGVYLGAYDGSARLLMLVQLPPDCVAWLQNLKVFYQGIALHNVTFVNRGGSMFDVGAVFSRQNGTPTHLTWNPPYGGGMQGNTQFDFATGQWVCGNVPQ